MIKIKKFIDFEIVTILTILILMSPFYFIIRCAEINKEITETGIIEVLDYQVQIDFNKKINSEQLNDDLFKIQIKDFENNLLYISNSDFEIIIVIALGITIIVNLFAALIIMTISFIKNIIINKNKKILSDEITIDEIEMPDYNIAIANTLYTGRIEFWKLFNFFRKNFEEKNIIDVNGEIISNVDINKLSDLEKEFILLCDKDITFQTIKEFKIKLKNELENKKYLKTNKARLYIDNICSKIENAGRDVLSKDKSDVSRIMIETLLPFAVLLFIAYFKWLAVILIVGIIYIQLKYYNIFLTKEGKREKARVTLYLDSLKRKKELSEKEKFFYSVLKYINL